MLASAVPELSYPVGQLPKKILQQSSAFTDADPRRAMAMRKVDAKERRNMMMICIVISDVSEEAFMIHAALFKCFFMTVLCTPKIM